MKFLLVIFLISMTLDAFDANENPNRHKSVRKAVDSFGKLVVKEVSVVNKFRTMFIDGKMTGQLRTIYAGYEIQEDGGYSYATALGGTLKYELASLHGFNAGFALTTSQDIGFLTGSKAEHNPELSSSTGNYSQLSEAYLNYRYKNLNLRAGRQILDTPLADSDDIRMIQNTFEAYIVTYKYENFKFLAGSIQQWQGSDAGLDNGFKKIGGGGALLGGITYNGYHFEGNVWYYDIPMNTAQTEAIYIDFGSKYSLSNEITLHGLVQYLHENKIEGSTIGADIYGFLVEAVAYGFGVNIAYNKSLKVGLKQTFAGVGGGSLFTSMDTQTIDVIAKDREVDAMVVGLVYNYEKFNVLYAYGDFNGQKNSFGYKAHITEQDMSFEYSVNKEFNLAIIYVIASDEYNNVKTANDFNRAQLMLKYNF